MKKINKKYFKKYLIGSSFLTLPLLSVTSISCSSNQAYESSTKSEIEDQFKKFANSLVREEIKNNLYYENFDFSQSTDNSAISLTIDQISNILSIPSLSNSYNYLFWVTKESSTQSILVELEVKQKNSNNSYRNSKYVKRISNIKTLSEQEKTNLDNSYLNWQNQSNNIEIMNTSSNQKLEASNFNNILPSYLKVENININYEKALQSISVNNSNSLININYDDREGQIKLELKIINPNTKLVFYGKDFSKNHVLVLNNFAKQNDRNNEISSIFNVLSKIIDVNSIITQNKKLPILPSGINTFEKTMNFFKSLKANISENQNGETLNNIITLLEESTQANKWFKLTLKTVANDVTGNLLVTWTIVDRFTNYIISPLNINKVTTINNLFNLKESIVDVDHIYQSYNLLKTLKIKNKYSVKASSITANQINNDWILTNTNIKDIFSDIKKSTDNQYLEFTKTTKDKTSSFRFKLNTSFVISNDIEGTLAIPFIMEIKLTNEQFTSELKTQYIEVLPPNGKSGTGENQSYNSAIRSASIVVGDYLKNTIYIANKIYKYFQTNQNIELTVNNEYYFNSLIGKNEDEFITLFEEQLKEKIKKEITTDQEEIKNFLESYKISFNLPKNTFVIYDKNAKTISTQISEIKLISKNNQSNQNEIPYYENGTLQQLPKSKLVVKFVANNN